MFFSLPRNLKFKYPGHLNLNERLEKKGKKKDKTKKNNYIDKKGRKQNEILENKRKCPHGIRLDFLQIFNDII